MRDVLFIVFLLLLGHVVQAQDFDIYPRLKDDNMQMPKVYENTIFNEYQLLSRNVRMMDMAYSIFVPGYVHFKAKDFATGYTLLGISVLGYSGILISDLDLNKDRLKIRDIPTLGPGYKKDKVIFYSSIALIISSYLFDWIHGKYRLEKKQEDIRYKYSIKLKMSRLTYNPNKLTPCLSLAYKF